MPMFMRPLLLAGLLLGGWLILTDCQPSLQQGQVARPRPTAQPAEQYRGSIACSNTINGQTDIFLYAADGSEQINLTNDSPADFGIEWSPDGTRLVFIAFRTISTTTEIRRISDIYTIQADGSNRTHLAHRVGTPTWSPDGTQIAVSTADGITIMRSDGTGPTTVLSTTAGFDYFFWSPDGTRLAGPTRKRGGTTQHQGTTILPVDGSPPMTIPGFGATDWVADGSRLIGTEKVGEIAREIAVADPSDGTVTSLGVSYALGADYNRPVVSPDGTQIAFIAHDNYPENRRLRVYVIDTDGSNLRQVTSGLSSQEGPAWSPDGSQLAFMHNRAEIGELRVINLDGTGERQVGFCDTAPQWQPLPPASSEPQGLYLPLIQAAVVGQG